MARFLTNPRTLDNSTSRKGGLRGSGPRIALRSAGAVLLASLLTLHRPASAQESPREGPVCPAKRRPSLLENAPERLLPCHGSEDAMHRLWGAHALRVLGRDEEAAATYHALAKEEALAPLSTVLRLAAARAKGAAGGPAEGLKLLSGASTPRRWLRAEVAAARADLSFDAGRYAEAIREAELATEAGHPAASDLHLLIARAALASEQKPRLEAALALLRIGHPESAAAKEAERLAANAGLPSAMEALAAGDVLRRWSLWTARGGAEGVAAECRSRTDLPSRHRMECGRALSVLRDGGAEEHLRAAAADPALRPQALLALARARSRGDSVPPVEEVCDELLSVAPSSSEAGECEFLVGFMYLSRGETEKATRRLEGVRSRKPAHSRAEDATWLLVMDRLAAAPKEAEALLDVLVGQAPNAEAKARALYWRGRSRHVQEKEGATGDWRQAERLDPLGYYGWLAAARLGETTEGVAGCRKASPSPSTAPAASRLTALLMAAGFARHAAQELDESFSVRARDAFEWSGFLSRTQRFKPLVRLGIARGGQGGSWPPSPAHRRAVEAAFPLAFGNALEGASPPVDRCLLLALMRRESLFEAEAVSFADARGLLQLLPSTAARLAEELSMEVPSAEDLHDAALNVRLASYYVDRLQQRFGHPFAAIAAYNAGPGPVAQWLRDRGDLEVDEWVERIPYRETRAYVKAVGGAWAAYARVYGSGRPPLPLRPIGAPGEGVGY